MTRPPTHNIIHLPSTCFLWPKCGCHQTITYWQGALEDADRDFTLEELEAAETVIFFSLACAAEHCPDAKQFANLTLRRQRIALTQLERLKERKDAS